MSVSKKIILSAVSILVLLLTLIACSQERDTIVSVEGGNPPTFKLTGSGNQDFLLVREATQEEIADPNHPPDKPEYLWEVQPKGPMLPTADSWPPITYGTVPPDFKQIIPSGGPPKPLEEGKTYLAGGSASNANGGAVWFKIENGKPKELRKSNP
jgi:hypothetical protein